MTFTRSGAFFVAVVVLVSLAGPALAGATWTMGFKGGVAISEFGGKSVGVDNVQDRNTRRVGFAGGFYAQVDVTDDFGIRLEGLYHMKGAGVDSTDISAVDLTYKLEYIEFPILLVLQDSETLKSVTLSVFAGPVLAFNRSAKLEGSRDDIAESVDIKDYIESFEAAITIGLGAAFDLGSANITLDGRYQLGRTNIWNFSNADVKNQGWAIMAGVGFPVGSN